jgi:hypothetical protein
VILGGPRLAQARKMTLESIGAAADNRAANVLPIIREIRKAGATTLWEIADASMREAWRPRGAASGTRRLSTMSSLGRKSSRSIRVKCATLSDRRAIFPKRQQKVQRRSTTKSNLWSGADLQLKPLYISSRQPPRGCQKQ